MIIQKGSSLHLCNDTEKAALTLGWFPLLMRLLQVSSQYLYCYHARRPVGSRPHQTQLSTIRCGHVNYDYFDFAQSTGGGLPFCSKSDYDASSVVWQTAIAGRFCDRFSPIPSSSIARTLVRRKIWLQWWWEPT